MRVWKLVSGILCLVLCLFILFQSCAVGLGNALQQNGESSGTAGVLVAIMMLAGGIVSIATRNSEGKGGNIALIVLFAIGAVIGFVLSGNYIDLKIWALWCLVCMITAIISLVKNGREDYEDE